MDFPRIKTFQCKLWNLRHVGSRGEQLAQVSTSSIGSRTHFYVGSFANGMRKLIPFSHESDRCVEIKEESGVVTLGIPGDCRLKSGPSSWPSLALQPIRLNLTWKEFPKAITVQFPNGEKINIERKLESLSSLLRRQKALAAISMALLFHIVAGTMMIFSLDRNTSQLPKKVLVPDLSKVQVRLSPMGHVAQNQVAYAKNLLRSWSVGKPITTARTVLKPIDRKDKFNISASKPASTWSLPHEDSDETPLNLTEQQIAAAFAPIQPFLKECYEDQLIRDANLSGKPQLWIGVSRSGDIRELKITNFSANPESMRALHECFFRVFRQVKVPKPNRDFDIVQTLVLSR